MEAKGKALVKQLDEQVKQQHLLNHPFYQDWQAGRLERSRLRLYAAEYYRHVEAFPRHLRTLASRASGTLREVILENLAEEENPQMPHVKLWQEFAAAVGASEQELSESVPLPGTQALVDTFDRICRERPVAEAVAVLYAYEAQVPEIATQKMDGLRRFYGVTEAKGLAYFAVHEEADVRHRTAWRAWLAANSNGNEAGILATAHEALRALWGALDAVQGASAESCQ